MLSVFKYLPLLVQLITQVEAIFGPGTGVQKRAAVIAAFVAILQAAEPAAEAAYPAFAPLIGELVDLLVKLMNAFGGKKA